LKDLKDLKVQGLSVDPFYGRARCWLTGVPRPSENAHPPKTPLGP